MWGQTGYGYGGGRPGIFDNILKGLDAIVNVTQAYQGYQAKKQHLEAGEREAALAPLRLQQLISPGEPVTPTEEVAKGVGKAFKTPWPKETEERRVKTMGDYWQSIANQGTVDEQGRKITSPTEPAQQARMAGETRTLATLGQPGGYRPMVPQTQPIYSTAGGVLSRLGEIPQHAKIVESDKNFTTFFDPEKGVVGKVSGRGVQIKKDKPEKGTMVELPGGGFGERMPDGSIRKFPEGVTPLGGKVGVGQYNHLIDLHKKLRPGQPINEENLQDLFSKFSKSGLNLEKQADRDAYKSAISILSKNINFRDMDPNDPQYDAMLNKEVARQKALVRGKTTEPAPVSSEDALAELKRRGLIK